MDRERLPPRPSKMPNAVEGTPLDILIRKLVSHSMLAAEDRAALSALPYGVRRLEPNEYILREGERAKICPILLSGFAFRQKHSADGGRQIVGLRIPGDPLDFQSLYLATADHNIQALTPVELAVFNLSDLEKLILAHPAIARAALVDILIEASIGREWLLNIGRRNALTRLAHLLCEIVYRLRETGSLTPDQVDLPMTQEQLADLLGLTPVHINRTLKTLEREGAIGRNGRRLRISDLDKLRRIAEFSDLYLHRNNLQE